MSVGNVDEEDIFDYTLNKEDLKQLDSSWNYIKKLDDFSDLGLDLMIR